MPVPKTISAFHKFLVRGRGALIAALLLAAAPALAQQTRALKIGFVDVDQAQQRSKTVQKNIQTIEDELKPMKEEVETSMRKLKQMEQDLTARRSVLAEDQAKKEDQKLHDLRDEIEAKQTEINSKYRRYATRVIGPDVDRILDCVKRVAAANGFDLVLRSDVVLFGVEALDITPLVVQELDRDRGGGKGTPALPKGKN